MAAFETSRNHINWTMGSILAIYPTCTSQERTKAILFCYWDLSQHDKSMPPSVRAKCVSPIVFSRSPASVCVSPVLRSPPLVTMPKIIMLFNAAVTTQTQPESSPSFMGSMDT